MENFQFCLLTYHLEAQIFLREVAPDVLTIVSWCGNLQNISVSHTVPRHTALHENFFCHTPGLTHVTPQLRLRPGRPVFVAVDFEPSDMRFNIRWST